MHENTTSYHTSRGLRQMTSHLTLANQQGRRKKILAIGTPVRQSKYDYFLNHTEFVAAAPSLIIWFVREHIRRDWQGEFL